MTKKEKIEIGDIVKVKPKKTELVKTLSEMGADSGIMEMIDEMIKDLKTMEGKVILSESEFSIISFEENKKWMWTNVSTPNEAPFYNKDIKIVKKADKAEIFFTNYNNRVTQSLSYSVGKIQSNIISYENEIKNYFRNINDYRKKITDSSLILEDIKNAKASNSLEKITKNKKVDKVYFKGDNIYVLTKPLSYYNLDDIEIIKDIRYVIRIGNISPDNIGDISVSNVSTYSNAHSSNDHCCVSGYSCCLGNVIIKTIKSSYYDLNSVILALIMFLEKPDYETPYINEEVFKNFDRYSIEFQEEDLSKAFDNGFMDTLK